MERKVYFTSDTHFHHTNVIRYCKRPFLTRRGDDMEPDVNYMNREMVRRWNSVVNPFDTIYHLGDVAMGPRALLAPTVAKLNGRKILIRGNHDRSATAMRESGFDEVHERLETEIDGVRVYMHHQPEVKARWRTAQLHLCGHVHEKWRRYGDMINVGVDQWDFTPRTLQELMAAERQGTWPKESEME